MIGVTEKSRVSTVAVRSTGARDILGAIVEGEGMNYEGQVRYYMSMVLGENKLGQKLIFVLFI